MEWTTVVFFVFRGLTASPPLVTYATVEQACVFAGPYRVYALQGRDPGDGKIVFRAARIACSGRVDGTVEPNQ